MTRKKTTNPEAATGRTRLARATVPVRLKRTSIPALLAATALALTACTGASPMADPSGSASDGSSAQTTGFVEATDESPAENVPVPEVPEAITEQSEDGAQAALDYWWEAHRYLELTGDGQPLAEASGSGCGSCSRTRAFWEDIYAKEYWSTGSERTPADVQVEMSPLNVDATFEFVLDQEDYDVWTSDGQVLNEMHRDFADQHQWAAKARFTKDGRWIIYDLWMYYGEPSDSLGSDDEPEPEDSEEADGAESSNR